MKSTEISGKKIFSEIESGKYRECYLIYNRKSTDEPNNQKNSIKYQRAENTRFAFRERLQVAALTLEGFARDGIVSERHSGFKENAELTFIKGAVQFRIARPKFYRLVQWLSKEYFKGVIFLCWDRASRNKGDDTVIRKLMKTGVDVRFALAQYDKTSAGELHMDIDGMFAEHHSRTTSEKVTISKRNKRSQGICTYKAPVGYLNQGVMEHKPIDPLRVPVIKKLFEMYGTGEWSLADLARWAIGEGFTMPAVRRRRTEAEILAEEDDDVRLEIEAVCRPPTYNNIHKILTNAFYTGKVLGNDGIYIPSASHEAVISEPLFNHVQGQLRKNNKSAHYAELLDHPLRGLVRCGECGRVYTPYPKKGMMYYGARCERSCSNTNRSFNFHFITAKIGSLMSNLSFTNEELERLEARTGTEIALLESRRFTELEANERRKKRIREDLGYLNSNRLTLLKTGAYSAEALVAEDVRLNAELSTLCDAERTSDVSMRETIKDVVRLSELLKNVYLYYENATPQEKERIIKIIFSELTISGDTLNYKCKNGFKALESRFVPLYDPTAWLSELVKYENDITMSIEDLVIFDMGNARG